MAANLAGSLITTKTVFGFTYYTKRKAAHKPIIGTIRHSCERPSLKILQAADNQDGAY
jgi:hypothetical protein